MHISNCVNVFVYQSLSVLNVMFRYPAAEIQRFVISIDMLWSCNMPAAWFSSLWSLRYQINVPKQHPCSPLFSTVLACIWCHVGGMRSALHSFFLKMGLSRENKSRQRSKSSSPVHPGEIFKGDARYYSQGHRKVRTSCNARAMVKEHGFKITKVKWSKGEKSEEDWEIWEKDGGRKTWRECVNAWLCETVFFLRAYKLYWR